MARFINSQGFWVDTDEEERTGSSWYDSLVPTMHPSGNPGADPVQLGGVSAPKDSAAVIADLVQSQSRIDTYTAEMVANVDVESAAGRDALRALFADPMQGNEVRAAASQALYPGMQTSIGKHGELSFSAAPGADLGFDYAGRTTKSNPELAARTKPALERLDTMMANIQNLENPESIIAAYSEIQLVANEFLTGKKAQYESALSGPLGVNDFDAALANSRALDQQAWNQWYGGQNMGDSDETMALIGRQSQVRNILNEQVGNKLKADPDAIAVSSRMRWLDGLIQDRIGNLDTVTQVGLVQPASIDAVAEGMGMDPNTLDTKQRTAIAANIANGDQQTLAAMQVGQATIPQLVGLASSGQGRPTVWALENLDKKFDTPGMGREIVEAVKNFDTTFLPTMTSEEAAEFELSPAQARETGKALEAAKEEVQAKKVNYVISRFNTRRKEAFESSLAQWDTPQAPEIAEEWIATVDALSAALPEGQQPTIQTIISGLNWDLGTPDLSTKVKFAAEYISSQAGRVPENSSLGPLQLYSDPAQVMSMINATIVGEATDRARKRIRSGDPIGSALYGERLWGWDNRQQ